jgi:hypothetical protein
MSAYNKLVALAASLAMLAASTSAIAETIRTDHQRQVYRPLPYPTGYTNNSDWRHRNSARGWDQDCQGWRKWSSSIGWDNTCFNLDWRFGLPLRD